MKVKGIILAAGKGTRMKSDIPKVLHRAAGRTMAEWAVNSAASVDKRPTVVVGHSKEEVMEILDGKADRITSYNVCYTKLLRDCHYDAVNQHSVLFYAVFFAAVSQLFKPFFSVISSQLGFTGERQKYS